MFTNARMLSESGALLEFRQSHTRLTDRSFRRRWTCALAVNALGGDVTQSLRHCVTDRPGTCLSRDPCVS